MRSSFVIRWLGVGILAAVSGCTNFQNQTQHKIPAPATASANCPPAGTEISMAKLGDAAFVNDYVGCDIKTRAAFLPVPGGADATAYSSIYAAPGKDRIWFQATDPNPGRTGRLVVALAKGSSDLYLDLKSGDRIFLYGRIHMSPKSSDKPHASAVLMAESINRAK